MKNKSNLIFLFHEMIYLCIVIDEKLISEKSVILMSRLSEETAS